MSKSELININEYSRGQGRANICSVDLMRASSPTRLNSAYSLSHSAFQSPAIFELPSALIMFDHITTTSHGKKIVMFLDYDGTLSPIVEDPDRAFMSNEMRAAVGNVATYFPTAIVSGRRTDKVLQSKGLGFGILVSKFPKETCASYSLQEPSEVEKFLCRLVEWKRSMEFGEEHHTLCD